MKVELIYCYDGKNVPEDGKEKLCLLKNSHRTWFEVCCYTSSLHNPTNRFWLPTNATELKPVYPYAWLNIDKESITDQFLRNLLILGKVRLVPKA